MKKPFAITLDVGTSLENRTGSWRTLRPTYVHKLPPCNKQCPAGEDIQGWLFYAESGNYEKVSASAAYACSLSVYHERDVPQPGYAPCGAGIL